MELSQKFLREVLLLPSNTYNYWDPGPERGRYLPEAAQVAQRGKPGSQPGRQTAEPTAKRHSRVPASGRTR